MIKYNVLLLLKKTRRKSSLFVKSFISLFNDESFFHREEKNLQQKYSMIKSESLHQTSIVVMIDGRFIHGGLTDRLKGICTIYHYCKSRNIPFYIYHVYPFRLETFLKPKEYDWHIDDDEIDMNYYHSAVVLLNDWQFHPFFHKAYLDRIISKNQGKQIHLYTNSPYYEKSYGEDYNLLFKCSDSLQEKIDTSMRLMGNKPYVAMVFRFQQLLGDFEEKGYPKLDESGKSNLIKRCERKVLELRSDNFANRPVLITSDSATFMQYMQKYDFVFTLPGSVVHMDYTDNALEDVYMKSFVDMYMISEAEKIYLLVTGDMYPSGFPKYAARLNNKPFYKIIF